MINYTKTLLLICTLTTLSALAPSTAKASPTSDIMKSILLTAHKGNLLQTESTRFRIGLAYERFLRFSNIAEPICSSGDIAVHATDRESCLTFFVEESARITNGTWSRQYAFDKAEFTGDLGVYNFYRLLPPGSQQHACAVVLQLSLDLEHSEVINDEFWLNCLD